MSYHLLNYQILFKTWEHLQLTLVAILLASLFAIPLGIFLAKTSRKKLANVIIKSSLVMQTIPGLALIALLVVVLAFLRSLIPLPTTGFLPATIVLVVYSFLPILTNTMTGINQVDPFLIEVADGMGMSPKQKLFWVELPLSLPFILSGVRVSLVLTVGMVTLTSLVGSGGLGDLIVQGLRMMHFDLVLAGTIPAACLALVFDWALTKTTKWLSPQM